MINVFGVTSWGVDCGIAEYAGQLREAWEALNAPIKTLYSSAALDPDQCLWDLGHAPTAEVDLVWLNHHAGLHSRWQAVHIHELQSMGFPVVLTLHDTRAGTDDAPNPPQLRELWAAADATIVHEPVADLRDCTLIRQGVPNPSPPLKYLVRGHGFNGQYGMRQYRGQPILGTVGFNFPWKNFDYLAEVTRSCGWGIVILSNNATREDEERWRTINPDSFILRAFLQPDTLVSHLAGCDVTAFPYECQNNGTSGAIRLGIAARKPVIAFSSCRQFRDLRAAEIEEGTQAIRWVSGRGEFERRLKTMLLSPGVDNPTAWVAWRDRWERQAASYLLVFDQVLAHFRRLRGSSV